MVRYWAVRTDKDNQPVIFQELQQGKLRQGWGYDDSQDLRLIKQVMDNGGAWWEKLTPPQREAYPHFRMLGFGEDCIKREDILLLPNLPHYQLFCLARVNGEYAFEKMKLLPSQQKHGLTEDYGHILPVQLLTLKGVNKYAKQVPADIRRTLRARSRLWSLGPYSSQIEELLAALEKGENLLEPQAGSARVQSAWESAWSQAKRTLQDELSKELSRRFKAAEWEEPILRAMRKLYPTPAAEVLWTGGAGEHGADLVVKLVSRFSDSAWQILVQVKDYVGEIADTTALQQLGRAYQHYGEQAPVLEVVVMTTADRESESFQKERGSLEKKLGVPVVVILRDRLIELMAEGLAADSAN